MSVYVAIDGGEHEFLASNKGWGDFVRWVETLDAGAFPNVSHLCEHGWDEPAGELVAELDTLPAPHHDDVADVLKELAAMLGSASPDGAVVVTAGMGSGAVAEAKDASGHDHAADGRFGRGGSHAAASLAGSGGNKAVRAAKRVVAAAHHAMAAVQIRTQKLALQAARERGLPEEHVARVGRVLAAVDFAASFAASKGVTAATGGNAAAGFAAGMMPTASLGYLMYSTARDPKATLAAAKKLVAGHAGTHEAAGDDAAAMLAYFHGANDTDWAEAVLYAALDAHPADPLAAVRVAGAVLAGHPAARVEA